MLLRCSDLNISSTSVQILLLLFLIFSAQKRIKIKYAPMITDAQLFCVHRRRTDAQLFVHTNLRARTTFFFVFAQNK